MVILTAPVPEFESSGFLCKFQIMPCDIFQSEVHLRTLIKVPASVTGCDFQSLSEQFPCLHQGMQCTLGEVELRSVIHA